MRWYNIGNHFRYERPQKGRGREFWQLNADIFGVEGLDAEIEIIGLAYEIMKSFGSKRDDFQIKVNDRAFVQEIFDESGLDLEQSYTISKIFDRKSKLTQEEFKTQVKTVLGDKTDEFLSVIESIDVPQSVQEVIDELGENGIENVVFDMFLMRGFDYYTGIVFEVFDTDPANNRSMFGGGRYDNLLDIFGEEKLPAVGFGMGDMVLLEFLQSRNLLPKYESTTNLYLCIFEPEYKDFTNKLAKQLREKKMNVAVDYSYAKIGKQIKVADKKNIPFVICIGEDEVKNDEFVLKNMNNGKNIKLNREELFEKMK
ncbi:MAG: ATP phosphoribosyltransferase regulatory subunit [Patescibacteria group bacterium]